MNELAGIFKDTRKHLMNGVSHMIPFVVTGGILMAVAVMAYGQGGVPPEGTWMATLWNFGSTALNLMVPVLSAYIAASIADRAGICPGFVGGMISISVGAGFLGGIVTGLLGGIVCYYLKKVKVPKALSSIMPIMIIPIVGSLVNHGIYAVCSWSSDRRNYGRNDKSYGAFGKWEQSNFRRSMRTACRI